jgi:hypothetical protein
MNAFIRRHLDPADRLGEILFGLIMALGFTGAVRLGIDEPDNRELFIAIFGCNLAWAVVDGVMYVMVAQFDRGVKARVRRKVLEAPNDAAALEYIGEEFGDTVEPVTSANERAEIYRWVLQVVRRAGSQPHRMKAADILAGIAVAAVIMMATFPVLIPFLVFRDPDRAVRVSHGVALVLLFLLGMKWGEMVGTNRWRAGAGLTFVGMVLVLITIALGG